MAIKSRSVSLGIVESNFSIDADIKVYGAFSTFVILDVLLREGLVGLGLFSDRLGRWKRFGRGLRLSFRLLIVQELLIDTSSRLFGVDGNWLIVRQRIFLEFCAFSFLNWRFFDFLGLDRFLDLFPFDGLRFLMTKLHGLLGLLDGVLLEHVEIFRIKVKSCHFLEVVVLLSKLLPVLRSDQIGLFMRSNSVAFLRVLLDYTDDFVWRILSEVRNNELLILHVSFLQISELEEGLSHATDIDNLLQSLDRVLENRLN